MKVLWYVNSCFPDVAKYLNLPTVGLGWWMVSLANVLSRDENITLGVVWASQEITKKENFVENDISYFCVPLNPRVEIISKALNPIPLLRYSWRALIELMQISYSNALDECIRIANEYKPDVIHVHGTENFYGLMTPRVPFPVVISFQGLLSSCAKDYWGTIPEHERFFFPKEYMVWLQMVRNAKREREIILMNKYFIGRTHWDRNHQMLINSESMYYTCQEVIRPKFHEQKWVIEECTPYSIYTTTTPLPYKGIDLLLEAIAMVKQYYPNMMLRIGGPIPESGYVKYLRRKVVELGLIENVYFLGRLEEIQIIEELKNANVFVLPSYVENSPNSLVEAQLIGVPIIASHSGGIPSLIDDKETGLLFSRGDAVSLAGQIHEVFDNKSLAMKLSKKTRETSLLRNKTEHIVRNQLQIYKHIYDKSNCLKSK